MTKSTTKSLAVAILLLFLHCNDVSGSEVKDQPVKNEGSISFPSIAFGVIEVDYTIGNIEINCDVCDTWGADGERSYVAIRSFRITTAFGQIDIPHRHIFDIARPLRIRISDSADLRAVDIEFSGGDGANFYRARFSIGPDCGYERHVAAALRHDINESIYVRNSVAYAFLPNCRSTID